MVVVAAVVVDYIAKHPKDSPFSTGPVLELPQHATFVANQLFALIAHVLRASAAVFKLEATLLALPQLYLRR